jgi:hypothetical protein
MFIGTLTSNSLLYVQKAVPTQFHRRHPIKPLPDHQTVGCFLEKPIETGSAEDREVVGRDEAQVY